ncbi:MAG: hypothetical protein GF350_16145 [Chitinivibrionales bacterium]|nr:hypothetical protein [Chitinivibrionales bacterium]
MKFPEKYKAAILAAGLCAGMCSAAGSEKTTISAYGFKAIDIPQSLAQSLQEHIESNLIHYNNFEIVSRNDIDKIFAETKLQQKGFCSDSECLIQAGTILGVSRLITGTISKVGTTYNLVLKMIDISNGIIESSVNSQCRGTIDSLLPLADNALNGLLAQTVKPKIILKDPIVMRTDTIVNTVVDTIRIHTFSRKEENALQPGPIGTSGSGAQKLRSIDSKKLGLGAMSILAGIALIFVINSII